MTSEAIQYFFEEFYGRMRDDLGRNIDWQREHPNERAANVLCSLGLIVYTEVLGRLAVRYETGRNPRSADAFYAFLDRMADGSYGQWRRQWKRRHGRELYDALRNGLAHEYVPKVSAKLWFCFGEPFGFDDEDGVLVFKIEPYYRDFCASAEVLRSRLLSLPEISRPSDPRSGDGSSFRASASS